MRVLPFSPLLTTVIRRDFLSICLLTPNASEIDQYPPLFAILPNRSRLAQVKWKKLRFKCENHVSVVYNSKQSPLQTSFLTNNMATKHARHKMREDKNFKGADTSEITV